MVHGGGPWTRGPCFVLPDIFWAKFNADDSGQRTWVKTLKKVVKDRLEGYLL